MLDFSLLNEKKTTIGEMVADFGRDDLGKLANEMIDTVQGLIAECNDEDVTFVPVDPAANDTFASDDSVIKDAWTLGHVIVHITASSEESAALAAELARGVPDHGRSRSEVPWETVTTLAQCRQRLEESRRMRLASLEMWPDQPYDLTVTFPWLEGPIDARARFVVGMMHENSHLAQIAEIVRQAKAARA